MALDHGGEEGMWTRRAKWGRGGGEGHGCGISLTLPEQRGPYGKVRSALPIKVKWELMALGWLWEIHDRVFLHFLNRRNRR